MLLRASDFGGVAHSSFAWSVALQRYQSARKEGTFPDAPEMLDDDLSKCYETVKDFENYPKIFVDGALRGPWSRSLAVMAFALRGKDSQTTQCEE